MSQSGTIVVQAVSPKYGNDSFEILYQPDIVVAPRIGNIIGSRDVSNMVSNRWTVVIVPAEESE